jgi:hypothetical protein
MANGITMGNVTGIYTVSLTVNPAIVATVTTAEQEFTLPGVKTGDLIYVNKPTLTAGLGIANVRASAANTVAITFVNPTAGDVNGPSETYSFLIVRPSGNAPATSIGD